MKIEQEHFEHWLMAQPDDRLIDAHNGSHCFIACFLREVHGCARPVVSRTYYNSNIGSITNHWSFLPKWFTVLLEPFLQAMEARNRIEVVSCGEFKRAYLAMFPHHSLNAMEQPDFSSPPRSLCAAQSERNHQTNDGTTSVVMDEFAASMRWQERARLATWDMAQTPFSEAQVVSFR